MTNGVQTDIVLVNRIAVIPTILDVICHTTGMGFAAITRVTDNHWLVCSVKDDIAFGVIPGDELKVEAIIGQELKASHQPVIIEHVVQDNARKIQSYISVPITLPGGVHFGTLCALDVKPTQLSAAEIIGMFKISAELIAYHLDANSQLLTSQTNLLDAQKTAVLREQFIAILGHDLRNPLGSITAGTHLLQRTPLNEKATAIVDMMQKSALRMNELVGNMLDFAHTRLGGGISLYRQNSQLVEPALMHVINELRQCWPDRLIETNFEMMNEVDCDPDRIAQLFSNLLSNALTHGAPQIPIRIHATTADGTFKLSVANGGDAIPPLALEHLFQPFSRGIVKPNQSGLGLGLHIAAEIAHAHDGDIGVVSTNEETRFTLQMPLQALNKASSR
jgi:signal transduction histidine kinase